MKTILCYGDSNTWGWDPATKRRYAPGARWPGVLAAELGPRCRVVEEGLNGRTTVWTDPLEEHRNGKQFLPVCLETHKPLDAVVILLGTNDLKHRFSAAACDIARGAAVLVEMVQRSRAGIDDGSPAVLLAAPPPVARLSEFAEMFEGAEPKSRALAAHYAAAAAGLGCEFLDAGGVIRSSDLDGIHLDPDAHLALGRAMADRLRSMLAL